MAILLNLLVQKMYVKWCCRNAMHGYGSGDQLWFPQIELLWSVANCFCFAIRFIHSHSGATESGGLLLKILVHCALLGIVFLVLGRS